VIGFIRGTLVHKEPPQLLVDVNGVGYELEAPMSTIFQLPSLGEQVQLRTHLTVRDDQQILYAFATDAERRLFRNLMKVSGVGAKLSLTILSGISVQDFSVCVHNEDKAALTRLPGVGRKTAERLIIEMRDRLDDAAGEGLEGVASGSVSAPAEPRSEAYNALVSLGYKPAEARRMLDAVGKDAQTTEEILRQVLRSAAP
jgi:Holliday junction DNA helicase RuvA